VSALFLAELMAWHGKSLGEMLTNLYREFGDFHYRRVDLDVTARQKDQAIAWFSDNSTSKIGKWRVANRESIDGVKLYLSDSGGEIGWVLVRASGTENLLRVYSETSLLAHWIRDEIREVAPRVYLGKVYWSKKRLIDFALEFPSSG
jgi:phosphomannomutase